MAGYFLDSANLTNVSSLLTYGTTVTNGWDPILFAMSIFFILCFILLYQGSNRAIPISLFVSTLILMLMKGGGWIIDYVFTASALLWATSVAWLWLSRND